MNGSIPGFADTPFFAVLPRRSMLRALGGGFVAALIGDANLSRPGSAAAVGNQRPLSDFVAAQGTTSNFVPPLPDFVGWANRELTRFASIDYAGLAARWLQSVGGPNLGTKVTGQVTERPLSDGSAEVTVTLHTANALTWVMSIPDINHVDFANDPLLFGYRATEFTQSRFTPALGAAQFRVVFKNTAPGAPLPDLINVVFDPSVLVSLSFQSQASGPLRPAFSVTDGTSGQAKVSQIGIVSFLLHPPGSITGDAFPTELINVRKIGEGTTGTARHAPSHHGHLPHRSLGHRRRRLNRRELP